MKTKIFRFSPELLGRSLITGNKLTVNDGIPSGARICRAGYDHRSDTFWIIAEHPTFDEVAGRLYAAGSNSCDNAGAQMNRRNFLKGLLSLAAAPLAVTALAGAAEPISSVSTMDGAKQIYYLDRDGNVIGRPAVSYGLAVS